MALLGAKRLSCGFDRAIGVATSSGAGDVGVARDAASFQGVLRQELEFHASLLGVCSSLNFGVCGPGSSSYKYPLTAPAEARSTRQTTASRLGEPGTARAQAAPEDPEDHMPGAWPLYCQFVSSKLT